MKIAKRIKKAIEGLVAGVVSQVTGGKSLEPSSGPSEEMKRLARLAAAEGIVLLKNDGALPIRGESVAIFGRVQYDYFCVGYGSGGDVHAHYKVNLVDGLNNAGVNYDKELAAIYADWREKNPVNEGFWGHWPRCFEEMPLTADVVARAAEKSKSAVVVIGRAAGEDRENNLEKGSYLLNDEESAMLKAVTGAFERTIVVMDCGNIVDYSCFEGFGDKISAIVCAWQGGMESGNALVDVLTGKVNPSGRLTDTIAYRYSDYPSAPNFGSKVFNNYAEDVYVGYRYFETFARDKVQFPFGFGLSYTTFELTNGEYCFDGESLSAKISVKNTGAFSGKESVLVYVSAPQGKLGKPTKSLCAFAKTKELAVGESEEISLVIPKREFSSYDDSGVTGFPSAFVMEAGTYAVFIGGDVASAKEVFEFDIDKTIVVEQLEEALPPEDAFDRIKPVEKEGKLTVGNEKVPTRTYDFVQRVESRLPKALPIAQKKGYTFSQVKDGSITLDEFVSELSVVELERICVGDITMNSRLGAKGNAGAFGGVSESLRDKGIPPIITTDGPSGIRLWTHASLLPCGTALASSFNVELVEELMSQIAIEMKEKGTNVLLAPGMNIHRDPLCGRNFEYFSEDPLLSGKIAAAFVRGVQSTGLSACPKHFACNSQETGRTQTDSRVSERALREIYLRGFEIAVKEAQPKNIMTGYNKINGAGCHYNYDLCTTILRGQWGYDGNVMTDWWVAQGESPHFKDLKNGAFRVRAGCDVAMPGGTGHVSKKFDKSIITAYKKGALSVGELQNSAKHVLSVAIKLK